MMRSKTTQVHLVTVLEEMPVQETIDGIAELRATNLSGRPRHRQPRAGGSAERRHPRRASRREPSAPSRSRPHSRPSRSTPMPPPRSSTRAEPTSSAWRSRTPSVSRSRRPTDGSSSCRTHERRDRPRRPVRARRSAARRPARRGRGLMTGKPSTSPKPRTPHVQDHRPGRPGLAPRRHRRRRTARRPRHRDHRVLRFRWRRQDHHVRGPGAAGGRAGSSGLRPHDRPGPAARPVDGSHRARQHPAHRRGRRATPTADGSTR